MNKVSGTPAQLAARRVWVDALRSGRYAQTTGVLKRLDGSMCCLGVLCDVNGAEWKRAVGTQSFVLRDESAASYASIPPGSFLDLVGMEHESQIPQPIPTTNKTVVEAYDRLWQLNDYAHLSFAEIADVIEAQFEVAPAQENAQ